MTELVTPSQRKGALFARGRHAKRLGAEANTRLTSSVALVLLILLAIEGLSILRVRSLLTAHVFFGMLLIPPVLVKIASTLWRFTSYYLDRADYQIKGPPPAALRILGPFVVVLTVVLFGSGVLLLLGPTSERSQLLQLHQASFILWFVVMTVHVLSHLRETARLSVKDWHLKTRHRVAGSKARTFTLMFSLVLGLIVAFMTIPHVGEWLGNAR